MSVKSLERRRSLGSYFQPLQRENCASPSLKSRVIGVRMPITPVAEDDTAEVAEDDTTASGIAVAIAANGSARAIDDAMLRPASKDMMYYMDDELRAASKEGVTLS